MARNISVEEQVKQNVESADIKLEKNTEKNTEKFSCSNSNAQQVVITNSELENLFNEWANNGHTDLTVDPSIAEKIREYLAYQKELDPLRVELAERMYLPFASECLCDKEDYNLYINGSYLCKVATYNDSVDETYRFVRLAVLKIILVNTNNVYSVWIDDSKEEIGVDIMAYGLANNWQISINEKNGYQDGTIKINTNPDE